MKIRNPLLVKIVGFVLTWFAAVWMGTVNFRVRSLGPDLNPFKRDLRGRYIYAFWHETLLFPPFHHAHPNIWILISQSADGELITQACRQVGLQVVRGSRKSGGVEALLELRRVSQRGHIVVTPDGPRGPRRVFPMGVVWLAANTGLPIVPVGVGAPGAWRANSWDRFIVPRPFSGATYIIAEPVHVPENLDRKQLELYRQRVQEGMERATEAAEKFQVRNSS